jgi:PST family polysaccharide transporter
MSLARKTFHSAAWNLATNLGGRLVTVVGTLVLTRYIEPNPYGQVIVASTLVLTANQLLNLGVGHYVVSKPHATREAVFHATLYYLAAGVLMTILIFAYRGSVGMLFEAPEMGDYIPGLAVAVLLDRIAFMPEKILIRDMRFRRIGVVRSLADIAYTLVSLGLAAAGWGAQAIVGGNVVRSTLRGLAMVVSAERRAWLSPCRPSGRTTSEIFAFAGPMWLGAAAGFAARRWDGLLVARLFGPATAGLYGLGQNLAEIPAIHVGEPLGDVLLPSFAKIKPDRRPQALIQSIAMMALIVFPMAVGLGTIAPTLVAALFTPQWQPLGPILIVLSAISIGRPIAGLVASYLQAQNRPWSVLKLEWAMVALLLASIATLGRFGPLWVCAATAFTAGAYALASLLIVNRSDGVSITRIIGVLWGPSCACTLMVVVILTLRAMLSTSLPVHIVLLIEIIGGAATYVAAAFVLVRSPVRELLRLAADITGFAPAAERNP